VRRWEECDTTSLEERHEDGIGIYKLGEVFSHMDRRSLEKMNAMRGITSWERLLYKRNSSTALHGYVSKLLAK
jgi:hypothetical protein